MKYIKVFLLIFIFGLFFFVPYNTKALGKEVATCNYEFSNEKGNQIKLSYDIYSDGSIGLPFTDGNSYSGDSRTWYHSDKFAVTFYNIARINSSTVTCPSIYVQENDLGVTVYPNPVYKDSCSGSCYNLTAKSIKLSKSAKSSGVKTKKIVSTCAGSSIGFYNRKSYVFPYFRIYSDGTKEWSINGDGYVPVTNAITGTVDNESFSFTVNDSLLDSVFSSSNATCPSTIYRCVTKSKDGYSYELSTALKYCSKDDFSTRDGQAFGSSYYNACYGDPSNGSSSGSGSSNDSIDIDDLRDDLKSYDKIDDCDSILGSTKDEDSVAWLLQQILNYAKIIGPILVAILSSLDFAKAIMASDDENMKKAESKLMIRLILAVALFLIPTLVSVILNIFGITTDQICGLE